MAIVRHDRDMPEKRPGEEKALPPEHLPPVHLPEGLERFSWRNLWQAILAFFQLERGLLYTLRDLFIRPQALFRTYLFEPGRGRYTNPVAFVLLTSALVVLVLVNIGAANQIKVFGTNNSAAALVDSLDRMAEQYQYQDSILTAAGDSLGLVQLEAKSDERIETYVQGEVQKIYMGLMTAYYNVFMLFSIPLVSWISWMLFRKSGLHYAEHMVINAYILAAQNLIFLPLAPGYSFDMQGWQAGAYLLASLSFQVYAYLRFFKDPVGLRVIRSLAATIVGGLLYGLAIGLLFAGVAFLMVMRHMDF